MNLPFSQIDFFAVFAAYNSAFPWLPVFTYLAGLSMIALTVSKGSTPSRAVAGLLGLFWLWNGIVYHMLYFRVINQSAVVFGGLFILQGVLFLELARRRPVVEFNFRRTVDGFAGVFLIAYAMLVYPLIGHALGHGYPAAPVFGMAPCPTTIFTLGLLMNTRGRLPLRYLVIPLLWSVVALGAALQLRVWEDLGLTFAGLAAVVAIAFRNRRVKYSVGSPD